MLSRPPACHLQAGRHPADVLAPRQGRLVPVLDVGDVRGLLRRFRPQKDRFARGREERLPGARRLLSCGGFLVRPHSWCSVMSPSFRPTETHPWRRGFALNIRPTTRRVPLIMWAQLGTGGSRRHPRERRPARWAAAHPRRAGLAAGSDPGARPKRARRSALRPCVCPSTRRRLGVAQ